MQTILVKRVKEIGYYDSNGIPIGDSLEEPSNDVAIRANVIGMVVSENQTIGETLFPHQEMIIEALIENDKLRFNKVVNSKKEPIKIKNESDFRSLVAGTDKERRENAVEDAMCDFLAAVVEFGIIKSI